MKHMLFFLAIGIISCTKENISSTKSVIGKWRIVKTTDCTSVTTANAAGSFIEFKKNGGFSMDTLANNFLYKQVCAGFNHYTLVENGDDVSITLYNNTTATSEYFPITFHDGNIYVPARYSCDIFVRTR